MHMGAIDTGRSRRLMQRLVFRSDWNAQRHGTAPDAALYLACLARQR